MRLLRRYRFVQLCCVGAGLVLLVLLALRGSPNSTTPTSDDWWLPPYVTVSANSGLYHDQSATLPAVQARLVDLTWAELNPADGVYDWSKLDQALAMDGTSGTWLRLRSSDVIHSPAWLQTKYPDLQPMRFFLGGYEDARGNYSPGDFYPPWHVGVEAEFRDLLRAFEQRGYGSHPNLVFMYMPGAWRWNEWGCYFVDELIQQGLTPTQFLAWFQQHVEDYVAAVGEGNRHKLVFTAEDVNQWCEGNEEWSATIGRHMTEYTVARGLSARNGLTEEFNYVVTDVPNWGTRVVTIGDGNYMVTNDAAPLLADPQRIFGTENECYNQCGFTVPPAQQYYHVKMANLKALQLRMNWVFIDEANYGEYPAFFDYLLKSLGKRVSDSPDAWAALREGYDAYSKQWVRNWERWLIQREVAPDGHTVRTHSVTSSMPYNGTSYEARRTDHARGSDYMYFGVDDAFIRGGTNNIALNITYLDDTSSTWWVEYDAGDGDVYRRTAAVQNKNDGTWKTTTLPIADAAFANGQRDGMDFRIYNGGSDDLTVQFVRVIKLTPPSP